MTTTKQDGDFKAKLTKLLGTAGALNAFCVRNDLSFNYVYRVAKGIIPEPSFSKASAIQAALDKEDVSAIDSGAA